MPPKASAASAIYTEQNFAKGVTMAQISQSSRRMLDDLLDGRDAALLDNAHYRLNIMVVKSHGLLADDHRGRRAWACRR
jgi:hypothetical protein